MSKKRLSDFAPLKVEVVISNNEIGYEQRVWVKMPSLQDWQSVYFSIDFPVPPKRQRATEKGKEDYHDVNDPEYLRKKDEATDKLMMRRVAQALIGGGDFEELQGLSVEDAANKLRDECDRSFLLAIYTAMNRIVNSMRGGVETKKAAFRRNPVPQNGHADMREEELVAGTVAESRSD